MQAEAAVAEVDRSVAWVVSWHMTCNQPLPLRRTVRCVALHQHIGRNQSKHTFLTRVAFLCNAVAAEGASYLQSPDVTAVHAAELKAAGGIITAQDLADAVPQKRELLTMQVRT